MIALLYLNVSIEKIDQVISVWFLSKLEKKDINKFTISQSQS